MVRLVKEEKIKAENPGILEVPEGKSVDSLPVSHFKKLIDKKGRAAIIRALTNLEVWNKNDDKSLSSWAKGMKDSLEGYGEKKESHSSLDLNFKETMKRKKEKAMVKYTEGYGSSNEDNIWNDAVDKLIEVLEDDYSESYSDLHNRAFNEDYYAVYTQDAENKLEEYGTFDAIRKVAEYEKNNFGEVNVDDITEPSQLVNMLFFIIGEEVMQESPFSEAFESYYNGEATPKSNSRLIKALNQMHK